MNKTLLPSQTIKRYIPKQWKILARTVGFGKECPICGKNVRSFLPLGGRWMDGVFIRGIHHPIQNFETLNFNDYFCPRCESSDRARLYYLFLQQELVRRLKNASDKSPLSILHFAPENLAMVKSLRSQPHVQYRTADLYRSDVDDQVDIMKMDRYHDQSFDIIICSHILEHVSDEKQATSELFRVLKPNGCAILMVPILLSIDHSYEDESITDPEERWKHFGQEDHVRIHSKQDFISLLDGAGFQVKLLGMNDFGAETFARAGIAAKAVLYVGTKAVFS